MLTYVQVTAAFDKVYEQLREQTNENAPSSYTWVAPTLKELADEVDRDWIKEKAEGWVENPSVVAYAYECNGGTLEEITTDWTVERVERLFSEWLGVE